MTLTSNQFLEKLKTYSSPETAVSMKRYFKQNPDDVFIGVRMGDVFKLAKEFSEMELDEVEKLMESEIHEARVGAVSILDYIARKKKTPEEKRKEIYDLYLKRHDRIDNWDLVDRAAIYVIGGYLADKDRSILYKLAKSKNMWERRTSIIATAYFMMKLKEVEDTCKIAEILIEDKEDLIHKATGWMLRVAGDVDQKELFKFLDKHAATMPRTALRYALEKVDKKNKEYYMGLAKKQNA
jgi:3-methyladenine DNA glycosylase AlkD